MNTFGKFCLLLAGLGGCLGGGCHQVATPALTNEQRQMIHARTQDYFNHAILFKPNEGGLERPLVVQLAPLIIQEVTDTNTAHLWRDQFAVPELPPQVSTTSTTTSISNRAHQQFTYTWRYPASPAPAQTSRKAQGVRLTLNPTAAPVIWEVLEDATGADIIYVAESLEAAARAEFGPPRPGRKFSIERDLAETPRVVVASVIADGPVAMGPIVFLQSQTREVTALICRCMPSQHRTLAGQKDYELAQNQPEVWPDPGFSTTPLEQRLRVPRQF